MVVVEGDVLSAGLDRGSVKGHPLLRLLGCSGCCGGVVVVVRSLVCGRGTG